MKKVALAVFGWGKPAAEALKNATEIVGIDKSGCFRNLGYGQIFFQQQALGALDAVLIQIADGRNAHLPDKPFVHIGDGQMNQIRQCGFGDRLGVVLVDIIANAEDALTEVLCAVARSPLRGGMKREQLAENAEHTVALVFVLIKGKRQRLAEQSDRFVDIAAGKNARNVRDVRFREIGRHDVAGKFDPVLLKKLAVTVHGVALDGFGREKKGAGSGKRNAAGHAVPAHDIVQNPDGTGHIAGVITCGRVVSADLQNAERRLTDVFWKKDFGAVFPNMRDDHTVSPLKKTDAKSSFVVIIPFRFCFVKRKD